jgi:uncharacterized membrane protein
VRGARLLRTVAVVPALVGALAVPAEAQEVRLTTPYPAVDVEAGSSATFDLRVTAPGRQRVELAVTQKPPGWTATLRGGGFVLSGVFTDPKEPPDVELEVEVPEGARPGTYRIVVTATSASGSDALELDLRVARIEGAGVTLTSEFPVLRGPSDATFNFDLDLQNDVPRETTFSLDARAPQGWQVEVRPTTEQQAATVTVEGGGTATLTAEVDPPDDVPAGTYPVVVRAQGGGVSAEAELRVEIIGNFAITLTTPDERLNAEVATGGTTQVPLVVVNDGTAPLLGIELSATPPAGWEVRFRPETIAQLMPGRAARVTATIRPSEDAVAGDYMVTLTARTPEVSSDVDIRTTVKTSTRWGIVGLLLIGLALGGIGWVFRRYGRR